LQDNYIIIFDASNLK